MNNADNTNPSILAYDGSGLSTTLQTTLTGLITGGIYQFSFTAINYVGESAMSSPLSVVIGNYPSPPAFPPVLISSS